MKTNHLTLSFLSFSFLMVFVISCKTQKEEINYLTYTCTPDEIRKKETKIDKAFAMLTGHFSNKEQASQTDLPIYREQEIISVPIWRKRSGEYWFYMGWYQADYIEKPLSMGIFEMRRYSRDTFQLIYYDIPNEEKYYNEWQKAMPFSNIEPKDLVHNIGCDYLLVYRTSESFEILPSGNPCKKRFMGPMHYFDFSALIHPDGQNHFHSFYDENKDLILTYPRPEGLNYRRLDKKSPKYSSGGSEN